MKIQQEASKKQTSVA